MTDPALGGSRVVVIGALVALGFALPAVPAAAAGQPAPVPDPWASNQPPAQPPQQPPAQPPQQPPAQPPQQPPAQPPQQPPAQPPQQPPAQPPQQPPAQPPQQPPAQPPQQPPAQPPQQPPAQPPSQPPQQPPAQPPRQPPAQPPQQPPAQPPQQPAAPRQQPPAQPGQQPPAPGEPSPQQPAPGETTPSAEAPAPISDAAYEAMIDKRVTIETAQGPKTGKLLSVAEDTVVLVGDGGEVISVRKADATVLRLASEKPEEQPPPSVPPTDGKPAAKPTDGKPAKPKAEPPPAKHKLGLFTSHGVAYSHFRTSDFRDGGPSYALDIGAGYNFSDRFGLYGLVGGLVGAPLLDKTMRGHFGHLAVSLAFKRKYIAFVPGLGVALSALRDSDGVDRRAGFALPIKVMGIIPLPKELFLGIGIGYDLGILQGGQIVNGISGQVTVGRW